ncbi:MAG: 4Fe-4S binding protein, partial [Chloroflexota bacterium]|nr:4Fe-4S binding protein [Chloroflexota bacterium]
MRTPKLRELKEALTSLFSKPYTVKFPYGPSIPPEEFRGKPKFVEEECIGCGACAQVCPGRAIDVTDVVSGNTGKRKLTVHYDHCIFCGQCQRYCTTEKGIVLTNDYDTPTYDRTQAVSEVEKNLVICEHCGAVVGTEDHIRWVARKLGTKAYAHLGL